MGFHQGYSKIQKPDMKIAFYDVTVTNSIGGIQTVVWELAHELASRGIDVHIYGGIGQIHPPKLHPSVKIFTFPFIHRDNVPDMGSRFQRIIERLSMTLFAKGRLKRECYDLIVLTKPFDFFVPFLSGKDGKTKYAFISGGTDFFIGDRHLAKKVNYWFACSYFNAWQIASHYKRYPEVIYNGVDINTFRPMPRDADIARSFNIKDNDVVFIFAGRLVGWKGVSYIIDAVNYPEVRTLPIKVIIIGNGPEEQKLKTKVLNLGIGDKIHFIGFVPNSELPRYYSIADAAVYPSIGDEAFGISIAEAMACGKPVIGSHIGGIPEVIGNEGSCGFLVSPKNPKEIAEKMILLAKNENIRLSLGQNAHERIVQNFTWRKSADRFLDGITGLV